jgi:hypothetical protein
MVDRSNDLPVFPAMAGWRDPRTKKPPREVRVSKRLSARRMQAGIRASRNGDWPKDCIGRFE